MERIKQIMSRVDELSLRERAIIFIAMLLIVFMAWYSLLMDPLIKEKTDVLAGLETKRDQLQRLNDQFVQITQGRSIDPDAENRRTLEHLQSELEKVDQELRDSTAHLVPPESMPEILRLVLNRSRGLSLLQLNGLGAQPLVIEENGGDAGSQDSGEVTDQNFTSPYRHGMQIRFTGNFFQTLDYMQALEKLEWSFFWDAVEFEVMEYPVSVTTITLYTLSLNQNWISIKKS